MREFDAFWSSPDCSLPPKWRAPGNAGYSRRSSKMDRNWVIWDVFELLRVYADISWHPEEAGASAAGSRPAGGGIWAAGAGLAVPRSRLGRALPDAVTEIACHLATIEPYKSEPRSSVVRPSPAILAPRLPTRRVWGGAGGPRGGARWGGPPGRAGEPGLGLRFPGSACFAGSGRFGPAWLVTSHSCTLKEP